MPQLPTLTITDAQASRILAAFGTVENYENWLADAVRQYVFEVERQAIIDEYTQQVSAKLAEIKNSLGM